MLAGTRILTNNLRLICTTVDYFGNFLKTNYQFEIGFMESEYEELFIKKNSWKVEPFRR